VFYKEAAHDPYYFVHALCSRQPCNRPSIRANRGKKKFITFISGTSLTNRLYGVTLMVSASGDISGEAFGRAINGDWTWQDGYFCREMAWGDRAIPYNCQLVEARGNEIRFTSDQGAGDSASFKLR